MGDTAEDELTEFELIEVESIKGVPMGANGFPHLIMKGVAAKGGRDCPGCGKNYDADSKVANCENCGKKLPAASDADAGKSAGDLLDEALKAVKAVRRGKVDEAPDVELGKQIMVLLGKAIENEAQEMAAGFDGEALDVALLSQAAELIRCWTAGEQTAPIDGASVKGAWSYGMDDVAKAPREFTEAERKKHAAAGNALPDGSYPIPDKDALRRAAILARSGHGNVAAAKRLIAKRARELGVPNPLDDDGKSDAGKSALAPDGATVQTDAQDGSVVKAVADAVTKALGPLKAEIADLRAFKAKVEKLPVPGGPVLSSNARPAGAASAEAEDFAAKAALYRAKADAAVTPADREGYRLLAREADEKAAKITA